MGSKYAPTTVTGYAASPPSDDGAQTDANKIKFSTLKQKLGDPLYNWTGTIDTALQAAFNYTVNQKTANYTTVAGDHMRTVEIASTVSSGITISLGDAATMTNNYIVRIKNSSGVACTLTRITGGDTIDGVAGTVSLPAKSSVIVQTNAGADGYLIVAAYVRYGLTPITGTFTPTFEGSVGAGTYTYTLQVGRYTINNNRCEGEIRLAISLVGGGASGDMRIAGLPVSPVAVTDAICPVSIAIAKFTLDSGYTQLCGYVDPTTGKIALSQFGSGLAHANLTASGLLNDSQITIGFSYEIA